MLQKVWTFITSKFAKKEQPPVVIAAPFSSVHHSLNLRNRPLHPPPRTIYALKVLEHRQTNRQSNIDYKLVITDQPPPLLSQKQEQENAQLYEDLIEQVNSLTQNMENLRISEERLIKNSVKKPNSPVVELQNRQTNELNKKRINQLKDIYRLQISDFMGLKYSKQVSQYPAISFEQFKQIHQYWKSKMKGHLNIKDTGFQCVQKLTYKALGGLDHGEWLNDDIINIYIEMMQRRFIRETDTPFRILNSYFATNTLTKTDTQIQRVVKKRNLDKSHILIMPVNNRNHWYFAAFQENQLVIHDSIRHNQQYYLDNPIFKNALKFAKMFFESQFRLRVRSDYPQQDNGYDCGIFMLMGIRDTLRGRQWSYHQGDMRFKRVQIAHEILRETLLFTE